MGQFHNFTDNVFGNVFLTIYKKKFKMHHSDHIVEVLHALCPLLFAPSLCSPCEPLVYLTSCACAQAAGISLLHISYITVEVIRRCSY